MRNVRRAKIRKKLKAIKFLLMAKINANAFCTSVLCSICIIINLSVFILFASITFGSLLKSECVLYINQESY